MRELGGFGPTGARMCRRRDNDGSVACDDLNFFRKLCFLEQVPWDSKSARVSDPDYTSLHFIISKRTPWK